MLKERGVEYAYRDYNREPFGVEELREVLAKLGLGPREILRGRDATKQGLRGDEDGEELIALMAENPNLVQRPIGVLGDRAVLGRPVENLLTLLQ